MLESSSTTRMCVSIAPGSYTRLFREASKFFSTGRPVAGRPSVRSAGARSTADAAAPRPGAAGSGLLLPTRPVAASLDEPHSLLEGPPRLRRRRGRGEPEEDGRDELGV